jgi:hypothetical protein
MSAKRTGATAAVMRYLERAERGKTVYLADVATAVRADGLDLSDEQVQSAVYHVSSGRMNAKRTFDLDVVIAGQAWRVVEGGVSPAQLARQRARRHAEAERDAGPVVGEVLEILAVTKTGALLVEDERGDTWKAVRV